MKKTKKGFTLIELLMTIIILGIVTLIAVAAVSNLTNGVKTSVYVKDEKILVKAAESYLASGRIAYPANIGDSIEISATDLQTKGVLDPIKSPSNRTVSCNGYVIVIKIDEDDYKYVPHLDCLNGVGSSTSDNLVVHYTFDDFQQPATNLVTTPLTFAWSYWPNASAGWAGSAVSLNSDYYDNDGQMRKYVITAGTAGSSNFQIYSGNNSITSGKTYGISFYVKALAGRRINVSIIQNGTPYASYVTASKDFNVTSQWQRFEGTFTATATATDARIQITTGFDVQNDEIYIYKPQLEERSPTPFVNGSRTATIKDYSGKGNSAALDSVATPIWTSDSKVGTGAYTFNGSSSYINAGNKTGFNLTSTGSVILWAKENLSYPSSDTTTRFQGIISKTVSGAVGQQSYYIDWYGTNTTRILRGGVGDSVDSNKVTISDYNFNNNWHNIALIWNGTNVILYVDGVEAGRTVQNRNAQVITAGLEIGRAFNSSSNCFNGSIDDVKIYSRALSASEILLNYNMDSYKKK